MPGSASTTRWVRSCKIYVILAMALARVGSHPVLGDERRQTVPRARRLPARTGRSPHVAGLYRAIEPETPAPSDRTATTKNPCRRRGEKHPRERSLGAIFPRATGSAGVQAKWPGAARTARIAA